MIEAAIAVLRGTNGVDRHHFHCIDLFTDSLGPELVAMAEPTQPEAINEVSKARARA